MVSNVSHKNLHDLPNSPPNTQSHSKIEIAPQKVEEESTLDEILVHIGQLGPFQWFAILLVCFPMLLCAIYSISYVFTAGSVVHRCQIAECDTAPSVYQEPWTQFAIPTKSIGLDQCNRFVGNYTLNQTLSTTPYYQSQELCSANNFDSSRSERCADNNFIFRDKEVTIANEFGIYCEHEWKLAMVGTIGTLGQFVGMPIGGFISDRYGRCTALALAGFFSAIFGIIRSFATNYSTFVIFEFLDNVASSPMYAICFIVGVELVGPQRRVVACTFISVFYTIGEILLAVVAKNYQNWRLILRIVYGPGVALIAFFWILPESVRWLLSQGRDEDAKNILRRAAKVNKRELSADSLDKMISANRTKLATVGGGTFPIKAAFKKLSWRIINCSFCWIVNVLVYYGISLNSVLLEGDKYNNFMLIALVEIPGYLLPFIIMDRFGRRYSLCATMLLSGISCLTTGLLPAEYFVWRLIFFLIGKLMITAAFQVLYFFASEIFPTNLRSSLLSFCSMVGRVGSLVATQTPLLAKLHANAPAILFATSAIISGVLALFFPETTNIVLPTTMEDAHNIESKQHEKKTEANCSNNLGS